MQSALAKKHHDKLVNLQLTRAQTVEKLQNLKEEIRRIDKCIKKHQFCEQMAREGKLKTGANLDREYMQTKKEYYRQCAEFRARIDENLRRCLEMNGKAK